jgi:hypothetical protein
MYGVLGLQNKRGPRNNTTPQLLGLQVEDLEANVRTYLVTVSAGDAFFNMRHF